VLDLDEPQSAWAALGDGYRVEGRIVTWEADDVLSVPANTAFRSGEGWAVFAVVEGRARLTPVVIGQVNAEHVEIRRGLRAGDAVIMYPGDSVREGVRVEQRQP
jgi:HlyD family secretion protein